ncbi:MAG: FtsW/RodA/SpoVE family cell cycle protein [Patescibacteria group bacterium]
MPQKKKADKIFVLIFSILISFGFFLFASASLGVFAKNKDSFISVFMNQTFLGLGVGLLILFILSHIHYKKYKQYAFYLFLVGLIISCLVFVPGLGIKHGGARRWLDVLGFSFQTAEFLKFSFVLYFAALLSSFSSKIQQWQFSALPTTILLLIISIISFLQPDYGTFIIIAITAVGMVFVAGIRIKHLAVIIGSALVTVVPIALYFKPYVWQRLLTFFHPTENILSSGYQITQSLIAIGSGGIFGKGFGKSIQKFGLLPEPMGDSIFAVTAEEWGFVGSMILLSLFLLFAFRGFQIANKSSDVFGRLLGVGIVILIVSQSFINVASMLNILPMIGMPLIFVSQGGTALLFALAEVGILLNISKYKKS